jgi:general secretion pathway protein A
MYNDFFGLREKPFEITPDPAFLFLSDSHREALAHLIFAARERKGFTVITGEVGTGKTTLIQAFLSQLNGKVRTAYIFNPNLTSIDFLRYICEDLGVKETRRSKGQYIAQLHALLLESYRRDEQVILIIDEAQSLDPALLEEIRLLTNLETPKSKLLQVVLVGQPELNRTLDSHEFRQLKQRVVLRYHMAALNEEDTERYIEKRLNTAGAVDSHLFTRAALKKIYHYSQGIPRVVNIVCDNALLAGYTGGRKVIGNEIVKDVIRKLGSPMPPKKKRENWKIGLWVLLVILLIIGGIFLFMGVPGSFGAFGEERVMGVAR